jgi:predicted O-methyltransferase YrrM
MDDAVTRVLDVYHQRIEAESKRMRTGRIGSVDEFLLPIGPAVGELLNFLIKEAKAKAILEIGTSYGYSTVWLAEAAQAVGGKVTTLELQRYKQDYAREALANAKLAGHVEFKSGNALDLLKLLPGPFDFVLVDLWKDMYVPCLDLFYPKLNPGALIAADNMIEPAGSRTEAAAYRRAVRGKPGIQSLLLPIGQGIELSRYTAGLPDHLV